MAEPVGLEAITVPVGTVVELGVVHAVLKCDWSRRAVIVGQPPATVVRAGMATVGRPEDVTTDTELPRFSFLPGRGDWLRICPVGAVIEVWWPVTCTTKRSWCSLASAWATVRPVISTSL